jgi:peptidyl-prolyl cis-trans isomerase D
MISWLQTRFQKHYQVLFLVLLAVIIVAFVFTIGASPGIGRADRTGPQREVFGTSLTTEQDQRDFFEVAQISAYLQTGSQSIGSAEVQDYAFQRAATLSIANSLNLPGPSDEQLDEYIRTLGAFAGPDGQYDNEIYARFLDNVAVNPMLSESIVAYVLNEDYRAQEANKLVGGPGYVLDSEVRTQQERLKAVWTVAEGTLSLAGFNPTIESTDEQLEAFYEQNSFRYEIPERMSVGYVVFDAADYTESVELTQADLALHFAANKDRYQSLFDTGSEESDEARPEVQLDDVRDMVESDLRLEKAKNIAVRTASDFAYALFENNIQPDSEAFASMISNSGLEPLLVPPFARGQIPEGMAWNRQIVDEAFKLTSDHWFSDPLTVGNTVILMFYQDRLASYTPEFADVRAQVSSDYADEQKRELFIAKGEELKAQLQNSIDSGKTFSEAATEAGLETKEWVDFTFQAPPDDFNYSILSRLDQIPVGGVSDMVVARDQGSIVHVVSRSVPADGIDEEEIESTRKQIASLNSNLGQSLIYSDMVRDELIRSGLADAQ